MRESGRPAESGTAGSSRFRRAGPLLAIVAVWAVTTILWLQPGYVLPDGAGYVVYLPSAWIDRNLLFYDEWQALGMIDRGVILHKDVTRTGHLGNHWTVGAALAWFPTFALADAIGPLLPEFPRNGLSLPYNVAIVVGSAMAGLATMLIGHWLAAPIAGRWPAAVAAIAAWLGTPLMWYSLAHATMAHAVSAMAAALVFAAAAALRRHPDAAMALLAGLAAGFAFAVRPQNAPLALVPLIVASLPRRRLPAYAFGIAAGALPQLVVSWFLYGSPAGFLTGGGSARPFAAFERVWVWEPLLSWYHGLFTWTPFAAIGVVGLLMLLRGARAASPAPGGEEAGGRAGAPLALAGLLVFASQWAINATMERSFWGATAFGQRRFDACVIVFLLGVAVVARSLPARWRLVAIGLPTAWTFSLFLAARASLLDLTRYVEPAGLMQAALAGLRSLTGAVVPLASTPAHFKTIVGTLAVLFAGALAAGAAGCLRMPRRAAATTATAAFMTASLFLYWCGSRDAALLGRYAGLIERNRILAGIPGGADVRFGLLHDEIDYLRRSGRTAEAAATARELADLERRRAAALESFRRR